VPAHPGPEPDHRSAWPLRLRDFVESRRRGRLNARSAAAGSYPKRPPRPRGRSPWACTRHPAGGPFARPLPGRRCPTTDPRAASAHQAWLGHLRVSPGNADQGGPNVGPGGFFVSFGRGEGQRVGFDQSPLPVNSQVEQLPPFLGTPPQLSRPESGDAPPRCRTPRIHRQKGNGGGSGRSVYPSRPPDFQDQTPLGDQAPRSRLLNPVGPTKGPVQLTSSLFAGLSGPSRRTAWDSRGGTGCGDEEDAYVAGFGFHGRANSVRGRVPCGVPSPDAIMVAGPRTDWRPMGGVLTKACPRGGVFFFNLGPAISPRVELSFWSAFLSTIRGATQFNGEWRDRTLASQSMRLPCVSSTVGR